MSDDAERCINLIPEKAGSSGAAEKSPLILLGRPGLLPFAQALPPASPPPLPPPVSAVLTVISSSSWAGYQSYAWLNEYGHSNTSPGSFVYDNTQWAQRANTTTGLLSPVPANFNALAVYAGIDGSLGGNGVSLFKLYDIYILVTYSDGSTQKFRPTAYTITAGDYAITNPAAAYDGDPATYTTIESTIFGPLAGHIYIEYSGFAGPGGVPPAIGLPSISSFTASPGSITSGGSSTLAWVTSGATSLFISAGVGPVVGASSSTSVSPTDGTTYQLTASNAAGSVTANATVLVTAAPGPPVVSSFAASPASIAPGQTTTLSWAVTGSASVSISGAGTVAASGSLTVSPGVTTNYVLTATGPSGGTATQSVLVTVLAPSPKPVISSFTASPGSITSGGSSTLAWVTSGATSLSISAGVGPVFGTSVSVSPTDGTTYQLTASNAAGSVTAYATVLVTAAPGPPVVSSFAASPVSITQGQSTTLSWSVSNSVSVSISGPGSVAASGSLSVSPGATTSYVLTATGSGGGTATRSVVVTVLAPPPKPVILSFTATPASIVAGGLSLLAWRVTGATSLSINQSIGAVLNQTSTDVSPTATTTYTLTATNSAGSVSQNVTVTVTGGSGPPVIGSFTASPSTITAGETVTLAFAATGAASLSINGVDVTGTGSLAVTPAATTTYVLTATSSAGAAATQSLVVTVSAAGGGALRVVGAVPGMQFARLQGTLAQNQAVICQYGDYVGGLGSPYVPWCPANARTQGIDIFLLNWISASNAANGAHSGQYIPQAQVTPFFVTCNGGKLVCKAGNNVGTNALIWLDWSSTAFRNWLFTSWFPSYLATYGPMKSHSIAPSAVNSTLVTIDAWLPNYGGLVDPTGAPTVWDAQFPQTRAAWYAALDGCFQAANTLCPQIRLCPHLSSVEDPSLAAFQSIYNHCPALMKEPGFINQMGTSQNANIVLNLYWFANQAPRLLPNDPPTRIALFGVWADTVNSSGAVTGQDYHSALAVYLLMCGPNTFFDCITTVGSQQPVNPSIWLPTYNHLGPATSGPVLVSGPNPTGFYRRSFAHGTAYYNFDTATHTATPPAGSTNWTGSPVTLVTCAHGAGEVVWGL